jgi:ABC-type sugar transport system, periplasmic component
MEAWDDKSAGWDRNGDGIAQYVIFQGSPESQEALDRSQYCVEGAEDKGYKFEKLADNYLCNWDATLAQEAMTAFLGTHQDDIEVVFCNNDSMAEGVVAALNAVGFNTGKEGDPKILVLGVDATDAGVQLINDGKMYGTVKQDGEKMAKTNVELAIRFAKGMTKAEAVADYGLEIFEGDNASVRIEYQAYTK